MAAGRPHRQHRKCLCEGRYCPGHGRSFGPGAAGAGAGSTSGGGRTHASTGTTSGGASNRSAQASGQPRTFNRDSTAGSAGAKSGSSTGGTLWYLDANKTLHMARVQTGHPPPVLLFKLVTANRVHQEIRDRDGCRRWLSGPPSAPCRSCRRYSQSRFHVRSVL